MFKAAKSTMKSVAKRSKKAASSVDDGKDGLSVAPPATIFDGAGGNEAAVSALGLDHGSGSTASEPLFLDAATTRESAGLDDSGGGSFQMPSVHTDAKKLETAQKLTEKVNTGLELTPGMKGVAQTLDKGIKPVGTAFDVLKLGKSAAKLHKGRGDSNKEADAVTEMLCTGGGMMGKFGKVFGTACDLTHKGSKRAQKECAFGRSKLTGKCMNASDDASETAIGVQQSSKEYLSNHMSEGPAEVLSHGAGVGTLIGKSGLNAFVAAAYGVKDVGEKIQKAIPPGELAPEKPVHVQDQKPSLDEVFQEYDENARLKKLDEEDIEDINAVYGDPYMTNDLTLKVPPPDPGQSGG